MIRKKFQVSFERFIKKECFKIFPILEYVIDFQRKVQEDVDYKNEDMQELIKLCKLVDLKKDQCRDELPAAMNAIIHLESLPAPTKADGTKFVALYKTLGDIMKGHPAEELDDMTRLMLQEGYAELEATLESPKGKEDFKKLKSYFQSGCYEAHPINEQFKALHEIMADPLWNPLNIPSEFLFNSNPRYAILTESQSSEKN